MRVASILAASEELEAALREAERVAREALARLQPYSIRTTRDATIRPSATPLFPLISTPAVILLEPLIDRYMTVT
jgi:hypothetical protein